MFGRSPCFTACFTTASTLKTTEKGFSIVARNSCTALTPVAAAICFTAICSPSSRCSSLSHACTTPRHQQHQHHITRSTNTTSHHNVSTTRAPTCSRNSMSFSNSLRSRSLSAPATRRVNRALGNTLSPYTCAHPGPTSKAQTKLKSGSKTPNSGANNLPPASSASSSPWLPRASGHVTAPSQRALAAAARGCHHQATGTRARRGSAPACPAPGAAAASAAQRWPCRGREIERLARAAISRGRVFWFNYLECSSGAAAIAGTSKSARHGTSSNMKEVSLEGEGCRFRC